MYGMNKNERNIKVQKKIKLEICYFLLTAPQLPSPLRGDPDYKINCVEAELEV